MNKNGQLQKNSDCCKFRKDLSHPHIIPHNVKSKSKMSQGISEDLRERDSC